MKKQWVFHVKEIFSKILQIAKSIPVYWRSENVLIGYQTLQILWPIIVASLAIFLFLLVPTQSHEYFHHLASDPVTHSFTLLLSFMFGFAFLSLLNHSSLMLTKQLTHSGMGKKLQEYIRRFIVIIPLIGLIGALLKSSSIHDTEAIKNIQSTLINEFDQTVISAERVHIEKFLGDIYPLIFSYDNTKIGLILIACIITILAILMLFPSFYPNILKSLFNKLGETVFNKILILGCVVCLVSALPGFCVDKSCSSYAVSILESIGLLAILFAFGIIFAGALSRILLFERLSKAPVLLPILVSAFIFSLLNWNDNHYIRLVDLPIKKDEKIYNSRWMGPEFKQWWASRPVAYKKKIISKHGKYPVYFVAAQGGGIYAANQVALTLSRLYDRCPSLRHHIFAISGVSGGAIGASLFSQALKLQTENNKSSEYQNCFAAPSVGKIGEIELRLRKALRQDFLSPLVAATLFPDLIQRVIPFPIDSFDRARALESSIGTALQRSSKSKAIHDIAFQDLWNPNSTIPMMIFGITNVDRGNSVAITPTYDHMGFEDVSANSSFPGFISTLHSLSESLQYGKSDIPLTTAAALSARFPGLLPAGTVVVETSDNARFVDGGYSDNSGIELATNAKRAIKEFYRNKEPHPDDEGNISDGFSNIEFHLIVLGTSKGGYPVHGVYGGLSEILSPLRTMLSVRVMRQHWQENNLLKKTNTHFINILQGKLSYPLGFVMSQKTQSVLASNIGYPHLCGYKKNLDEFASMGSHRFPGLANAIANNVEQNSCTLCRIIKSVTIEKSSLEGLDCAREEYENPEKW